MTRKEFDKRFRWAKYSILAMVAVTVLVVISYFATGSVSWWILTPAVVPVIQLYHVLATSCASCNMPLDRIAQSKSKRKGKEKAGKRPKLSDLSTFESCPHCGKSFFDAPA